MAEELYQMVYRSDAQDGFDPAEINNILEASNRNNVTKNITGMLFYKKGIFLQVLEGKKSDVLSLYEKILKDPRHKNSKVYWDSNVSERSFPSWSMAFKDLSELSGENIEKHKDIINQVFDSGCSDGSLGYQLFMRYKESFMDKL